jgi:ligand-binding sensor domain-containing protein/signal transduction histidine kinase
MKESRRYIIVLLSCLMLLLATSSQAQRYSFYNQSVENGLIQSQATCFVQDKMGHLWIGTLGGLSRYDGKSFTNYSVRDGMVSNTVSSLACDKNGNLWVGGPKGIAKFNGKKFEHYIFEGPENPGANAVSSISIADDGTIWCIAAGRIYSIANGKSRSLKTPDDNKITALVSDGKELWMAKYDGLVYHYTNNRWDSLSFGEALPPRVYNIYRGQKNLWLSTSNGLYSITNNKILSFRPHNMQLGAVGGITEDNAGALWLGTRNGAIKIKDSSVQFYNKKNGLTDNTIFDVLTDAEGNIWFASDGQGIYRYSGSQFTMLDESMNLPSAQIMSIASAHGRLYLGTYDAGLYTYENGEVYKVPLPVQPPPAITAIAIRNGYDIWLGTRGSGIWKYNGGTSLKSYTYPTIPSNNITAFYSQGSKLWVGFINGAIVYENDTFHKLPLKPTSVLDFISLGSDSMLIATDDGIMLYHNDAITAYKTQTATDSAFAQCFTLRGNELWIGTSDNGLICYNRQTGKSYVINRNNGLQSDFIYNITTDNDGNIWAGTGYGIHRINTKFEKPLVTFYGKEHGIRGMESNHNAVLKMQDGSIWFGTIDGAVHYSPQAKFTSSQPTTIVLQSVKVFGESISDTTFYDSTEVWYNVPYGLKLPYKKNNLTFTFQAISLTGIEQVKYRYRIDGLDAPWSDWSSTNTVTYSALPPGKYTLQVECVAGNEDEVRKLSYPFEIITPFQKTNWFKMVIILGCILLGITIQYITNRRKQNRLAMMQRLRREEQNKVRERTAEDFHDEVGNKLTRINVLTDVLRNKIGTVSPDTQRILDQIKDNTSQLYGGTRDILWSLKPSNDSLYEILYRIRDFGTELFQDTEIDFIFTGPDEKWHDYKLPLDVSRNLIMIFKESLNNTLKYAKAKEVKLDVHIKEHGVLQLILSDNGIGFDINNYKKGHGIDNMNVRAKRIHAILYLDSRPGKGTIINLSFRLPDKQHISS